MASPFQIQAMREANIGIAAICCPKMYIVFDNGVYVPIQRFLDEHHEPTDDPERYTYYEFGTDEFGYGVGNYDTYTMPSYEDH